jgi:hypothetical protein
LKNKLQEKIIMKKFGVEFSAYEVREPSYDGRGFNHKAYFANRSDAQKCIESTPDWSRAMDIREVNIKKSWTVYESYDEYDPVRKQQRKEEVLARLSTEEKELLGLL